MVTTASLRLDQVVDFLPDALVIVDDEHRIALLNPRAEELFGYGSYEVVGQDVSTLIPLDAWDRLQESVLELEDEPQRPLVDPLLSNDRLYRVRRSDGTGLDVRTTLSAFDSDGRTYFAVSLRAIAMLPAEGTVSYLSDHRRFHQALDETPIVIATFDRSLRYTWMYNTDESSPLQDGVGLRDDQLTPVPGVEELVAWKRQLIETGEGDTRIFDFGFREGARTYQIIATPVVNERGQVTEVHTVCIDITQQQSSMRSQRDFVSMVAHDLRGPIGATQMWAMRLLRQREYDEAALREIVEQTHRLNRMVEDLLDTSAIESGNLQLHLANFDLAAVVRQSVEYVLELSPHHRIRVALPEEPVLGRWDRGRLSQVLENLLTNAVKYSPAETDIDVVLTAEPEGVALTISDQGRGISPADMDVIFEAFGRATATLRGGINGLGLGLCIAKGLVEAHGGKIVAHSPGLGKGSTFRVTLPYRTAVPSAAA